jgi:hypothetical protein
MTSFEQSSKPWFGPRKRARELLTNRIQILEPHRALREMKDHLGPDAVFLQHVRFIDFVHKDTRFRFTIAIIWTDSRPHIRNRLYFEAEEIVLKTGWYPLPQGERLNSGRQQKNFRGEFDACAYLRA